MMGSIEELDFHLQRLKHKGAAHLNYAVAPGLTVAALLAMPCAARIRTAEVDLRGFADFGYLRYCL